MEPGLIDDPSLWGCARLIQEGIWDDSVPLEVFPGAERCGERGSEEVGAAKTRAVSFIDRWTTVFRGGSSASCNQ